MIKDILKKGIVSILTLEAKLVLGKYKPKIVAVTGSVGKTSTKDAIYTVLSPHFITRKSIKSFNSEIGVPLTIIGCNNAWTNPFLWIKNIFVGLSLILLPHRYPEWLVLEVGADRPGDIYNITRWLKPDVSVVTKMSKVPVHVEFFPSVEDVVKEKSHLAQAVKPNGVLILNSDDDKVLEMSKLTSARKITFGFLGGANVHASNESIKYEFNKVVGMTAKVNYEGNSVPINLIGALGRHQLYPVLSAIAVGLSQGINIVEASQSLVSHIPPQGRMHIISGIKGSTVIDDTYNSSPVALLSALDAIKEVNTTGRKIAVLGDMLELGKYSVDEHKKAGEKVAETCNMLITVGMRARYIAEGALNKEMDEKSIFQFDESREAGKHLETLLRDGDIVLVKGSQSIRMEKTVFEIMAEPENADKVLVRQDEEWKRR